jgi:hypothetical protein
MDPQDPNDPPDPTAHVARDYDDVAKAIGASVRVGEVAAMLDLVVISNGGMPADLSFMGENAMHFKHATGVRNGVTFDYLYHCNDGGDVIIDCSSTANHSHITLSWTGSVSGAMAMSGITNKGSWTVRDISVAKPRVGGTSALDFTAHVNNADYVFSFDSTLDHVRYEPGGQMPLSGKIDIAIMASRTRDGMKRDFTVAASLVFAGNNSGTLTLDSTKRYSVDLSSGAVTKL